MRAALVTAYGDASVVKIGSVPEPRLTPGHVIIRVRTSAVNSGDWRVRSRTVPTGFGLMIRLIFGWSKPKHPIFGMECAGVIESIAPDIIGFAIGDPVIAQPKTPRGCHAELVAMPTSHVIAKPSNLTWEEAGAFGFGGVTALHFLSRGGIRNGTRVLIIGASGSVGSAAVQIAKAKGAHVTGIASGANRDLVVTLGADEFIDYTVEEITARNQTWDIIMDTRDSLSFRHARKLLAQDGRYLGIAAGLPAMLGGLGNPFRKQKAIFSVAEPTQTYLLELAALAKAGLYKPLIDSTFPLERARDAHARVETHRKRGNVVLQMSS